MKIIKNIADIPLNSIGEELKNYTLVLQNGHRYKPEYQQYSQYIVSRYAFLENLAQKSQHHYLVIGMDTNIQNTINFFEFISLYRNILGSYWNNIKYLEKDTIINKLKIPYNEDEPLQIGGIFISDLASRWDSQLQIIMDLLTTENGKIGNQYIHQKQHIPIYICMPEKGQVSDKLNMNDFKLTLESTYRLIFNEELDNLNVVKDSDLLDWQYRSNNIQLLKEGQDQQN